MKTSNNITAGSFFKNLNVGEEAKTRAWLDEMGIKNYTINKDGTVDVKGGVNISSENLTEIPVQFNKVGGSFWCDNNNLNSLKGAPKVVSAGFYCSNNNLTSLQGAPKEVAGSFYCSNNNLTTLDGAPKRVYGTFDCGRNKLISLNHVPKEINGIFYCQNNKVQFTREDIKAVSKVKLAFR